MYVNYLILLFIVSSPLLLVFLGVDGKDFLNAFPFRSLGSTWSVLALAEAPLLTTDDTVVDFMLPSGIYIDSKWSKIHSLATLEKIQTELFLKTNNVIVNSYKPTILFFFPGLRLLLLPWNRSKHNVLYIVNTRGSS